MSELQQWYKKIPSNLLPKYRNPSFDQHRMSIPFRCMIVGGSGSGKSTLVLEMLHRMKRTFELVVLCCKSADEPLYKFLRSKVPRDALEIYENGEVPPLEKYENEKDAQILMVFDDLCLDKNANKVITDYAIRCRKIAGGVSMIYLSQSYKKIPKTVRIQCNYIILKKLTSTNDLKDILADFSLTRNLDDLLRIYKEATKDRLNFLMVDIDADPKERFRRNFLEILKLPEDEEEEEEAGW